MGESMRIGNAETGTAGAVVRGELLARRDRLAHSAWSGHREAVRLLVEVDAALRRFDRGAWGDCERCDGTVESQRLQADPLARVCLECLTEPEARSLERDLELASTIQAGLLPRNEIRHAGWEIAFRYVPLGPVSGDHLDVLVPDRSDDPLHIALGDVSGKGVAAALLMSHLQATLRTLARMELPLDATVARTNRLLTESTILGSYATMVVGRLEPDGGVELTNAGHCPPVVVRSGSTETLPASGIPLGLVGDTAYDRHRIELTPGDLLFLYSDGLSEAGNPDGEHLGEARLRRALISRRADSLDDVLDACLQLADQFRGEAPRTDDTTLMAIRRI